MKIWQTTITLLASCALVCAHRGHGQDHNASKSTKQLPYQPSYPAAKLISFDAFGNHVALGLDYLVPFLEVPVKRKRNAPPRPLVVVNTGAIISCGLIAVGGIFVGHLIRTVGLETIEDVAKSDDAAAVNHTARALSDNESSLLQLFENFKLVYRNQSGERVETTLPSLFNTIESTFLQNDINLEACVLKSLCALVQKAGLNVQSGQATDLERVLDGAVSWSWLLSWLEQTPLREAIEAGKNRDSEFYCALKYPSCKWTAPEEQLLDLMSNNIKFA